MNKSVDEHGNKTFHVDVEQSVIDNAAQVGIDAIKEIREIVKNTEGVDPTITITHTGDNSEG